MKRSYLPEEHFVQRVGVKNGYASGCSADQPSSQTLNPKSRNPTWRLMGLSK